MAVSVAQVRGRNAITVRGVNSAAEDTAAVTAAVNYLNTLSRGALYLEGDFKFNAALPAFTKPISLFGVGSGTLITRVSGTGAYIFSWTPTSGTIEYPSAAHYDISATAGNDYFYSGARDFARGDVVVLYSSDAIANLSAHHAADSASAATYPASIHKVQYWDSVNKYAYVESELPDTLSTSAKAGLYSTAAILEDVTIANLTFVSEITTADAYAITTNGTNGLILENLHIRQNGAGAISLKHCLNTRVSGLVIEGTKASDLVYGVMLSLSNGFVLSDFVMTGTRHAFTTSSWYGPSVYRYGGPLHSRICNGVVNSPIKQDGTTTIILDTHPEANDTVFEGVTVTTGTKGYYGLQTRGRNTTIQSCKFRGRGVGYGVLCNGPNTTVQGCLFDGLTFGIWIGDPYYGEDPTTTTTRTGLRVVGNVFRGVTGPCLINHTASPITFANNTVEESGNTAGGYPHFPRCATWTPYGTGHLIAGNTVVKALLATSGRASFDIGSLTSSQVKIVGNSFSGFTHAGTSAVTGAIGRFLSQKHLTADPDTDVFTSYYHGLSNTNHGTLIASVYPTGLDGSTIYYVVNATTSTFQLSLTSGGAAVTFTTSGSGLRFRRTLSGNDITGGIYTYVGNGKELTLDITTDTFAYTAHGLAVNDYGYMRAVTLPTIQGGGAMSTSTPYFVVSVPTPNTFTLSQTYGGGQLYFSAAGAGLGFDATCPSADTTFSSNWKV